MADAVVPLSEGLRFTATVYQLNKITGNSTVVIQAVRIRSSGLIMDYFVSEQSLQLVPDTMELPGLILDNFISETGWIIELENTDLLTATTTIPAVTPVRTLPLAPSTIAAITSIPIPTIFHVFNNILIEPLTLEALVEIPAPNMFRVSEHYKLLGDPVGWSIVPAATLTVNRPETVDRYIINIKSVHIDTDAFRLFMGKPVAVPKYDVRAQLLGSNVGHYITDREDQLSVDITSDIRWVVSASNWDKDFYRWYPLDDGLAASYWWESSAEYTPDYHNNFTYYVGKEQFNFPCLSFFEDTFSHMWSSWANGNSSSEELTIMMVVNLQPVQKNQDFYTVIDSGTQPPEDAGVRRTWDEQWAPDSGNANYIRSKVYPHRVNITMGNQTVTTPNDRRPSFNKVGILTMHWDKVGFYAEWVSEEGKYSRFTTPEGVLEGNDKLIFHNLLLGRANGSLYDHEANMDIFEMNVWTSNPKPIELRTARSALRSVYGIIR